MQTLSNQKILSNIQIKRQHPEANKQSVSLFLIFPTSWDFLKICLLCTYHMDYGISEGEVKPLISRVGCDLEEEPRAENSSKGQHCSKRAGPCCENSTKSRALGCLAQVQNHFRSLWNFWMVLDPRISNLVRLRSGRGVVWPGLCQVVPPNPLNKKYHSFFIYLVFFFSCPLTAL